MTFRQASILLASSLLLGSASISSRASDLDEFTLKRKEVFEFTRKPAISRQGDRVTIAFESKDFCDATIAIEDAQGRIVRHLASGVLGAKAPEPFQKNSLAQVVIWDGKDDLGTYFDSMEALHVRVSLGLKPQFEKTLYWSPHKRLAYNAPLLCSAPEGVYVCEGLGVDSLKLFDHAGKYVRAIYPFPSDKVGQISNLQQQLFPQDNQNLPLKIGFHASTLLSSGTSGTPGLGWSHEGGYAATGMAVENGRIALAYFNLNRLSTDGSSGGLPIKGPKTGYPVMVSNLERTIGPTSLAFSPDGKWLYMTGYIWKHDFWATSGGCYHAVMRMEFAGGKEPEVFAGQLKSDDGYGTDNAHFCVPTSVACDAKGRVYVSDYTNDRIQVFSPEGKYLQTLPTPKPAKVLINPRNQEIFSFSWAAIGPSNKIQSERKLNLTEIKSSMARLGTLEQPKQAAPIPLPFGEGTGAGGWIETGGQVFQVAIDPWADPLAIWVVGRSPTVSISEQAWSGQNIKGASWENRGIHLLTEKDGKWEIKRDFAKDIKERVAKATPADFSRQRLFVNPVDEKLYVGEEEFDWKSFDEVLVIDPKTGKNDVLPLPFDTEDLAFDRNGLVYLRTDTVVLRFDSKTWREIPYDYGEEREKIYFQGYSAPRRWSPAISGLPLPGHRPGNWHMAGMGVSAKGNLAVTCLIQETAQERKSERSVFSKKENVKVYTPKMYPGRMGSWVVHVWDKHGKVLHEDAAPGMPGADGLQIDKDDNIYLLANAPRILDGKPYFDGATETLVKIRPGSGKFASTPSPATPVQLTVENQPKRSADLSLHGYGVTWAEGCEWLYGGVGFGGQRGGCICWHARFALDYFARSFAPEIGHFSVAVLDSNGNLILRVGRYGNIEDGKPLDPAGGPAETRSIGGDEVALCHAGYVGTHSDKRLYISDAGNMRILSVKLAYHAEETVALKRLPDGAK